MSLVAYESSDESSEDEGNNCDVNNVTEDIAAKQTNDKLYLPTPKYDAFVAKIEKNSVHDELEKIHFDKLPKPKKVINDQVDIVEDDDIPPKKEIELKPEKPIKKNRTPIKITVPSLSEFKDVEEESETKCNRFKPSSKGTKLFALLPPPKGIEMRSTKNLIPSVVNKTITKINEAKVQTNVSLVQPTKSTYTKDSNMNKMPEVTATKSFIKLSHDSSSEDEDDTVTNDSTNSTTDFFALTATESVLNSSALDILNNDSNFKNKSNNFDAPVKDSLNKDTHLSTSSILIADETPNSGSQKTLVSNVINLPKEEILLKNRAEVGPKLPIPEQEYNIDTEGNVAFDDKAIEYLCGRRGVKRKTKEIEEANIIEINGEDIKPDEREWLIKALTEEPVQRPVSMQGGGMSSQSKKKHQITYLAHQAKAMEMELKNQWAQNRMTRKQTQSKYGF